MELSSDRITLRMSFNQMDSSSTSIVQYDFYRPVVELSISPFA